MPAAGRFCPPDYRIRENAYTGSLVRQGSVLYVVGGLYGNPYALDEIERLFQIDQQIWGADECQIVFNGDFHWFDATPDLFADIERRTSAYVRLRGNVETELARAGDAAAGCGCAYPETVPDQEVNWSNTIIGRLAQTAREAVQASDLDALAQLDVTALWQVGNLRVAITHGDHESLAGWSFSQDRLAQTWRNGLAEAMRGWQVNLFASSHTCLPVADCVYDGLNLGSASSTPEPRAVINNGAAGMANANARFEGVITRIAPTIGAGPPVEPLYEALIGDCSVAALPVQFDLKAWQEKFLDVWPEGSAARLSYLNRIRLGPDYSFSQAARRGFQLSNRV